MKKTLDKIVNGAVNASVNVAAASGLLEAVDYMKDSGFSDTSSYLAGIAGGIGLYELNKRGLVKKAVDKTVDATKNIKGKVAPYVKSALLAGAITGSVFLAKDKALDVYDDFSKNAKPNSEVVRTAKKASDTHVGGYETIQNTKMPAVVLESFFGTNKNDLAYFSSKSNREHFCEHVIDGIEKYVAENDVKKIIIAGGHGENYPGALYGKNKDIHESKFTKEMSKYIVNELKKDGFDVKHLWYEGNGGQKDRLDEYVAQANKEGSNAVYVEVHADAASPSVAGSRVYGPKPKGDNPKSHKFGRTILNEINKSW
jgi:N-acetylmuramoyl-L-alanine amidase